VRDVVKLEIEEDAVATADQLFDQPRTMTGEQPAANFEAADEPAEPIREPSPIVYRIDIQGDE